MTAEHKEGHMEGDVDAAEQAEQHPEIELEERFFYILTAR